MVPVSVTPTGNVQFYTNGVALGTLVALNGGMASVSTANLAAGTNSVVASYLGGGNFLGSSNSLAQVVYIAVERPRTVGVHYNGDGTITVTFSGTPGATYRVQASSDLGSAEWGNVSTNTVGSDGYSSA